MTLIPESEIRDVHGITEEQKTLIKAFLQGAVYSWVKNRLGEQFAARDLVGGENFEWEGTPLFPLYQKHIDLEKEVLPERVWKLQDVVSDNSVV